MWGGANVPCRRWNLLEQDPALPFFIGLFCAFGKGDAVCLKPYPAEALGHDGRKGHPAANLPLEQVIRSHIREALPHAGKMAMLPFVHGCPPDLAPGTAHTDTEGTTMRRRLFVLLIAVALVLLLASNAN